MFSPEQFAATSKANVEAQIALVTAFTNKTFEGVEKLLDLQLAAAKSSLEDSNAAVKQLLAAKDAQEWLNLVAAHAQPATEKTLAYGRELAGIASSLQAEFAKLTEQQITEANRKVLDMVEEASKNTPPGSENAVALLKAAIGNASAGYEQFSKTAKQAVETMEANLSNAVAQITQPAAKAAARSTPKKAA